LATIEEYFSMETYLAIIKEYFSMETYLAIIKRVLFHGNLLGDY